MYFDLSLFDVIELLCKHFYGNDSKKKTYLLQFFIFNICIKSTKTLLRDFVHIWYHTRDKDHMLHNKNIFKYCLVQYDKFDHARP